MRPTAIRPRQWFALDRLLSVAAAALMLGASWTAWAGGPPAPAYQSLASLAAAFALLATLGGIRGHQIGFALLWGALGMAVGLGLLGILDIGVFYLVAALILVFVIASAPNWTNGSRTALPYIVVQVIGFVVVLAPLVAF